MSENQSKKSGKQVYVADTILYTNEFERLKHLIYLFSCHRKMQEKVSTEMRPKLLSLMALYMKYGYSTETKDKAVEILGVKKQNINSMNLELRNGGYLIKDKMNTTINHLHPDLVKLKDYADTGDGPHMFIIMLQDDNNGE